MRTLSRALLCFGCLLSVAACNDGGHGNPAPDTGPPLAPLPASTSNDWYREQVFYAVAVRQFQDSDGDGMGDLDGLTARLDYIRSLGAGVLVLDQVQPGSLDDGARAVSDFVAVDPRLGGAAAWERLVDAVHTRHMRLVVTLTLNHVDSGHPWFVAALDGDAAGRNRFRHVTAPVQAVACADLTTIPFDPYGGDRWQDAGNEFVYYHRFATTSPDLDWSRDAVRIAAADTVRYWLATGADGVYLADAFAYAEDGGDCDDSDDSHARLQELRGVAAEVGADRLVLAAPLRADTPPASGDEARMRRYAAGQLAVATQWQALLRGAQSRTVRPNELAERLVAAAVDGPAPIVFASGHPDAPRLTQTISNDDRAMRQALAVVLTAPAVAWLYYGDEFGIGPATAATHDTRDLASPTMPWAATEPHAGFSTATPWWPEATLLPRRAVDAQDNDSGSVLGAARALGDARNRLPALHRGTMALLNVFDAETGGRADGVLAWLRQSGEQSVVVVHNMAGGDRELRVRVDGATWLEGAALTDVLRPDRLAPRAPSATAPEIIVALRQLESAVFALASDVSAPTAAAP